jgi:hypothetical protein
MWNVDGKWWTVALHLILVKKIQSFSPMMIMGTNATTYSLYSNPFQEQGSALSTANRELCIPNGHP